jgi:hypothetical protein
LSSSRGGVDDCAVRTSRAIFRRFSWSLGHPI